MGVGGMAGSTEGEEHTEEGVFVVPKADLEPDKGEYWEVVPIPGGGTKLVYGGNSPAYEWRWEKPGALRWSGKHRRRGTWTHIDGKDWKMGNYELDKDAFPPI